MLHYRILQLVWIQVMWYSSRPLWPAYQEKLTTLQATNAHHLQALLGLPAPRPEPARMALPETFDGSADCWRGFLRQCEIFFTHQPKAFHDDTRKCAFMMTLLMGRALNWTSTVWVGYTQIHVFLNYLATDPGGIWVPGEWMQCFGWTSTITPGSQHICELCYKVPAIKFQTLVAL